MQIDIKNYDDAINKLQLAVDLAYAEYRKLEADSASLPHDQQINILYGEGGEGARLGKLLAAGHYALVKAYLGKGNKELAKKSFKSLMSWDR